MTERGKSDDGTAVGPFENLGWDLYDALTDEDYVEAFSLWVELGRQLHAIYLSDPRVRAGWRKAELEPPQAAAS